MPKLTIRAFETDHFDNDGIWEVSAKCTLKSSAYRTVEESKDPKQMKQVALELATIDVRQKLKDGVDPKWNQGVTVVKFCDRGVLLTKAELSKYLMNVATQTLLTKVRGNNAKDSETRVD